MYVFIKLSSWYVSGEKCFEFFDGLPKYYETRGAVVYVCLSEIARFDCFVSGNNIIYDSCHIMVFYYFPTTNVAQVLLTFFKFFSIRKCEL